MNDGRDVRSCKGDAQSKQMTSHVEGEKNHMLRRCESVGGSKNREIKTKRRGQGGKCD